MLIRPEPDSCNNIRLETEEGDKVKMGTGERRRKGSARVYFYPSGVVSWLKQRHRRTVRHVHTNYFITWHTAGDFCESVRVHVSPSSTPRQAPDTPSAGGIGDFIQCDVCFHPGSCYL